MSYSLQIKSPHNTSVLWHVFQEHGMRCAYAPYSTIKACIVPDARGNVDEIVAAQRIQVEATIDLRTGMSYQE